MTRKLVLNKYKIVKATHRYSKRPDQLAYAVVATEYMLSRSGDQDGDISTEDPDDMYVIAYDFNKACMYVWEYFDIIYKI